MEVHEIIPKSLAPKEWKFWKNRVLLCRECHRDAHDIGTPRAKVALEMWRDLRLEQYYEYNN